MVAHHNDEFRGRGYEYPHRRNSKNLYFPSESADNAGVNPQTVPSSDLSIEEARGAGFDMNLIDINLSLSPEERWRQHDLALAVVEELENARMARDARLQSAVTPTR